MGEEFDREEHLKEVHRQRKQETAKKVDKAIKHLIKDNEKINFNKVAKVADVSKSTLYKREGLRERIENLREQQAKVHSPSEVKKNMDDDNKDAVISSLKRKIERLKEENQELKEENKKLKERLKKDYGEIYKDI